MPVQLPMLQVRVFSRLMKCSVRIDPRRAPCGHIRGNERDKKQRGDCQRQRERILRGDAIQPTRDRARAHVGEEAAQQVDLGFDPAGLLTFKLLASPHETPARREALMAAVRGRLRAMPGVRSVTAASPLPLADTASPIRWGTEDALIDASTFQAVDHQAVLPGYFGALRTPLIAGRSFTSADNAPDRNVAIVDQLLAAKAFPGESAVGKRLLIRIRTPEPEWVQVIGVVAHQRASALAELGREQIYLTDGFMGHGAATRWALRTAGDPAAYEGAVRGELAKLGGELVMTEMQSMDALVERAQGETRFSLLLIGSFASIAAILAAVGLYGVLSTVVRQRTGEIGLRMAIGAAPSRIFALVFGQGFRLSIAGILIGLVAAFCLTHMMASMLVGIKATDPTTFATMTVLCLLVVGAASWLPARRAAHLDPIAALRKE
ncbi:MAG: FtsX-like permease family protein [Vicinamibacteraceae bacterium]